jgi:hypothetical protein
MDLAPGFRPKCIPVSNEPCARRGAKRSVALVRTWYLCALAVLFKGHYLARPAPSRKSARYLFAFSIRKPLILLVPSRHPDNPDVPRLELYGAESLQSTVLTPLAKEVVGGSSSTVRVVGSISLASVQQSSRSHRTGSHFVRRIGSRSKTTPQARSETAAHKEACG